MIGFLVRILGNSAALYAAYRFVPGFDLDGGLKEILIAGLILGILNLTVKPFLKLISFPIIILTLGLFTLVINAVILWLVDYIFSFISISSLTALFLATIVIALVNIIISSITKAID